MACRLLNPEADEDTTDYRLPLSDVVKASIGELTHQTQPFSAVRPKIPGYRDNDYAVCDNFQVQHAKLDDDVNLLAKPQSKLTVNARHFEELERLSRQALVVASHAEWVLGSAVLLLQNEDTAGAIRSIESVGLAQSHNAGLLARMLANFTHVRRDQFLATSSLSSAAKASLSQLPMPTAGTLFDGRIAETISKDANTSSHKALVSIASSLTTKSQFKLPAPSTKTSYVQKSKGKDSSGFKNSFRGKEKDSYKKNNFQSNFQEKK